MAIEEETKKQGPAWKNSRLFTSYEEADEERNKLLATGDVEVKVKSRQNDKFVVKSRKLKSGKQQNN